MYFVEDHVLEMTILEVLTGKQYLYWNNTS
jgi:hypothetical protein